MRAIAKIPAHFGFLILRRRSAPALSLSKGQVVDFRLPEKESGHRVQDILFMLFFLIRHERLRFSLG